MIMLVNESGENLEYRYGVGESPEAMEKLQRLPHPPHPGPEPHDPRAEEEASPS